MILIVGGGPAGCAAALTLRRYVAHLDVTIIARRVNNAPSAVGETLSPGVIPLLDYLGVGAAFRQQGHLPSGGTASAWGTPFVAERNYLFTGRGHGFHLDRASFDAWLLDRAKNLGATIVQSHAVRAKRECGVWTI